MNYCFFVTFIWVVGMLLDSQGLKCHNFEVQSGACLLSLHSYLYYYKMKKIVFIVINKLKDSIFQETPNLFYNMSYLVYTYDQSWV